MSDTPAAPPRRRSVQCQSGAGLHRMAYREWGDARNPRVLVCVHGLTRSARDFDILAGALCDRYRVVCPDVAGRGDSDWLADARLYTTPQYVGDMVTLIARLDVAEVHWVGTSMGALIGMSLAALAHAPITRLVMNDAGPVLAKAALERIAGYVGLAPEFSSFAEAARYVRSITSSFGPHSEAEWHFLCETVLRGSDADGWRLHYDPRIGAAFRATLPGKDIELWETYEALRCPTLVAHGETSDLLTRETCERMRARGPKAEVVEFAGVGHAPTLMHEDQIAVLREFLTAG
ncbi:MAG: alpha/beta hydrolase [Betaproteobacteria bacterium]|nr:alpha/beta hydrolase [Betaproteobacteria bacterium]